MTSEQFFGLYNYWIVVFLMMTGFYIVIARRNMIKTVIGLNIFQGSVVLLYVTMGKVTGGTAPIIANPASDGHASHDGHGGQDSHDLHGSHHVQGAHETHGVHDAHGAHDGGEHVGDDAVHEIGEVAHDAVHSAAHGAVDAAEVIYSNPLPSVLMLTAIVVGIATTAVALSLIVRISEDYGTIEEDEILLMDRRQ